MGTLFVVATPIGNLNDMSKRAIETLQSVDYILCEDTRTSLKLLNSFEIKNKLISYHKFNEKERSSLILKDIKSGKNIALISDAGTPCISDPGEVIVKAARENNIPVIGVGGISALITALSISGLSTENFTFHGFFPRDSKDKNKKMEELKNSETLTHVFYESPKRIVKTLEYINENLGNLKVSVLKELTKIHEKNYYGNLDLVITELKKDEKKDLGEYTFILEKEKNDIKQDKSILIESLLLEEIIRENISLKEAIDIVNKKHTNLSKKEIYNASLNLKDTFSKIC